jgi:serine/threonine protein kinase
MSLCVNPSCPNPANLDNNLFCQACGSELLLSERYRITRLLSDKGGFGKTYEVTDNGTTKVLKVLINNHPKAVDLFQQEARVLSQLNHPGIPKGEGYFTVFPKNSGETPVHCLVMEKIEGLDLEEYQQQQGNRPIDEKLALEWLHQLAEILHEVHSRQFFHRDIKPSNIILNAQGQLVLIDFGTAREVTTTYMSKQAIGGVTRIDSAGYTPPEQMNFQAVPQSDFYALGRTFLYLLTGKIPTDPAIYDALNDELNWRSHAPSISPQLADFIDKLMMRSARQRPADTQDILNRLAEIEPITNPSVPPCEIPAEIPPTVSQSPVDSVTHATSVTPAVPLTPTTNVSPPPVDSVTHTTSVTPAASLTPTTNVSPPPVDSVTHTTSVTPAASVTPTSNVSPPPVNSVTPATLSASTGSGLLKRRKLLLVAGFAGVGLVAAVLVHLALNHNSPLPTPTPNSSPIQQEANPPVERGGLNQ